MQASPQDLAQVRLDNALALFEEFVRATARHADAATLRGLEKRFAEKIQIQPSYWSQIKGRSRQIGERLARQFEQLCHKPAGWMDVRHPAGAVAAAASAAGLALTLPAVTPAGTTAPGSASTSVGPSESTPRDDDERFIVGLVLTYYRRHPQRARARLLDLLGEVLTPGPAPTAPVQGPPTSKPGGTGPARPAAPTPPAEDARDLWLRSQSGVAPLKKKP